MEVENTSRCATRAPLHGYKARVAMLLSLVVIGYPNSHALVATRVALASTAASPPAPPMFTSVASLQQSGITSRTVQPVATPPPSTAVVHNSTLNDDLCLAGPDLRLDEIEEFYITGYVYIQIGSPVHCSGVITAWDICYGVFAFRNAFSEIWPCVWREKNGTFRLIGENKIGFIPSQDNGTGDVRCREDEKPDPYDYIEVEEGDFIGFFLPDNGLFVPEVNDPDGNQLRREEMGFVSQINYSELLMGTAQRALVRAKIGNCTIDLFINTKNGNVTRPIIIKPALPASTPTPSNSPTNHSDFHMVALIISVTLGGTFIIVLAAIIVCLGVLLVIRKKAATAIIYADSMEYNGMYQPQNEAEGQRKVLNIDCNPAYAGGQTQEATSGQALDHTYESLSNLSVHITRHFGARQ